MENEKFKKLHNADEVVIGLSVEKLLELMRLGVLCGADVHVKNAATKKIIQQTCLNVCAEKVCQECDFSDVCGVDVTKQDCQQCLRTEASVNQTVYWAE